MPEGMPPADAAARLGVSPQDLDRLARTLCAVRGERPDGVRYGAPWRPEGVTFLEMARRDVGAVLEALAALPGRRAP